ncbi:hypothetical protein SIM91_05560 [Rhodococcus opacus]|nr:hypothetical protein [Rhodococcus opacus]MDX5962782.1 hypothetical protein [Rhodococcus opacus]CAG7637917.1 hypothetical protein E143388_07944 [Rhodococcus opacus]
MRVDIPTAGLAELATLDEVTRIAEAQYVRQLLSLPEYTPEWPQK